MCIEQVFVWDYTSTFAYIYFMGETITLTDIRFREWEGRWFLRTNRAFHGRGSFLCSLRGSTFSELRETISLFGKGFYFVPSLLMSLLLLWRESECCMTMLEKSTLTYFCTANSPLHGLVFVFLGFFCCCCFVFGIGLLKIVRIIPKRKCSFVQITLIHVSFVKVYLNNSFLIIAKRMK